MGISAVVASRNSARTIGECVSSLRDFEKVVVVDNRSRDGTREIAASLGAEVLVEDHAGFFGAYDLGFRETESDFVMFIDSDAYLVGFDEGRALASFRDPKIGMVVCLAHSPVEDTISKLMDDVWFWRMSQIEKYTAGRKTTWLDRQYSKFFMSEGLNSGAVTTGPCYILRREAVLKMGGMDRNADDFVLRKLLRDQGYGIRFYVSASVLHHARSSLTGLMRQFVKHGLTGAEISAKFFSRKERIKGMGTVLMSIPAAPYIARARGEPRLLLLVPLLRSIQAVSFIMGTIGRVSRRHGENIGAF